MLSSGPTTGSRVVAVPSPHLLASPGPGWYRDPAWPGRLRLWDGLQWSDSTRAMPAACDAVVPLGPEDEPQRWLLGCAVVALLVLLVVLVVLPSQKPTVNVAFSEPPTAVGDVDIRQAGAAATRAAPSIAQPSTLPIAPALRAASALNVPSRALRQAKPSQSAPALHPASPPVARFRGRPSDFSLTGYRWNPCLPISVSSSGPDVRPLVAELASVTGLRITVVQGPAQIEVSWGRLPMSGAIGETYLTAAGATIIHATVDLSPRSRPALATVLRHELGHALGLGHASQADEVMYPVLRSGAPVDYQAGDLAGLDAVGGSSAMC